MPRYLIGIEVIADDNFSQAQVRLVTDTDTVRTEAMIVATEHMMTFVGIASSATFDKAMALLVEGAKKNHVQHMKSKGRA